MVVRLGLAGPGGAGRPQSAIGEPRPCLCHLEDTLMIGHPEKQRSASLLRAVHMAWVADYFRFAFRFFFFAVFFFAALRAGFFAAILRTVGFFFLLFIGMKRLPLEFEGRHNTRHPKTARL